MKTYQQILMPIGTRGLRLYSTVGATSGVGANNLWDFWL